MEFWRFVNPASTAGSLIEGQYDFVLVLLSVLLASLSGITTPNNRSHFTEILEASIRSAGDFNNPVALLIIGLRNIKANGQTADREREKVALRHFSERLKSHLSDNTAMGHFTGGEFAVLLEGVQAQPQLAIDIGRRLQAQLQAPQEIEGEVIQLQASAGVNSGQCPELRAETMIIEAQVAMRIARNMNEGCCLCSPEVVERDRRRNFAG